MRAILMTISMVRANSAVKIAGPRTARRRSMSESDCVIFSISAASAAPRQIRIIRRNAVVAGVEIIRDEQPRTWSSACFLLRADRAALRRGVSSIRRPVRTRGDADRSRSRAARGSQGCDRPIRMRHGWTLASEQRVERGAPDQEMEVKRIQIHQVKYISYAIEEELRGTERCDKPINGEQP